MDKICKIGIACLLFVISEGSFAQENFTFGFRGGVLYSDALGNTIDYGGDPSIFNPFSGAPINLLEDEERKTSSLYYGLVIQRMLNSWFDISVELNNYKIGTDYYSRTASGSSTQIIDQELSIEALNLPIYVTYSLDKYVSLGFSAGGYINFIRDASYYYHQEQTSSGGDPISNTIIYDLTNRINQKAFGILFKINVSKKVLGDLSLGIEGFYNRDLTYLDKEENRNDSNADYARFYAYGLGLQVFYSI